MIYIFNIIFTIVIFHLIYEGIIAPALRMKIRNNLFELRDELRNYHATGEVIDYEAFELIHSGINNFINRISSINIHASNKLKEKYRNDKQFQQRIKRLSDKIDNTNDIKLKDIDDKATRSIALAFAINHGGWGIYILPLIICFMSIKSIFKWAQRIFLVPSQQINSIAPSVPKRA